MFSPSGKSQPRQTGRHGQDAQPRPVENIVVGEFVPQAKGAEGLVELLGFYGYRVCRHQVVKFLENGYALAYVMKTPSLWPEIAHS